MPKKKTKQKLLYAAYKRYIPNKITGRLKLKECSNIKQANTNTKKVEVAALLL